MSDLLYELHERIAFITLNRVDKHNAFDNHLLEEMQKQLTVALADSTVRVLVLKANGKHFSAGADLSWMRNMTHFTEEENVADAMILGKLMYTLNKSPKPTVAMVQGAAFGGGAGLVAACDLSIAAQSARFCFSEVKLGLLPAVISPYVIQAVGERNAKALFMSAEIFDAPKALSLNLIQHCIPDEDLLEFTQNYATQISTNAPNAVIEAKALVNYVANKAIDEQMLEYTAALIAKKRVSLEGQQGLKAFLQKETPDWNKHV